MEDKLAKLQEIVDTCSNIVFFGGAGVSTESGIPDFRSTDGLYNQSYDYPPETILSRSFFRQNPEEFFRFYREKMLFLDAKPNNAHKKLAKLEEEGKIFVIRPLIPTVSRMEKDYDKLQHFYMHGNRLMKKEYQGLLEYLNE